jgi:acetolactate synthase-1/2/3 large subunit
VTGVQTCALPIFPIKVAIINNSSLGMVRQWQTLFYDGRHSFTDLNTGHKNTEEQTLMVPDFVKLAEAYGALGIRVTKPEEIDPAIQLAIETNDRPVVIDFIVSRDAMVWPMVPQGVGNSQMQYARDLAPTWDEE